MAHKTFADFGSIEYQNERIKAKDDPYQFAGNQSLKNKWEYVELPKVQAGPQLNQNGRI